MLSLTFSQLPHWNTEINYLTGFLLKRNYSFLHVEYDFFPPQIFTFRIIYILRRIFQQFKSEEKFNEPIVYEKNYLNLSDVLKKMNNPWNTISFLNFGAKMDACNVITFKSSSNSKHFLVEDRFFSNLQRYATF